MTPSPESVPVLVGDEDIIRWARGLEERHERLRAERDRYRAALDGWNKAAAHAGFAGSEYVDDPAAVFAALAREREGYAALRRQLAEVRRGTTP